DEIEARAFAAAGESEPSLADAGDLAVRLEFGPRLARGLVEHMKERAPVDAEADGPPRSTRGVTHVEDDARPALAVETMDRRAERAHGLARAHRVEHMKAHRLEDEPRADRPRRR